ncbi:hypothetical protein B0G93_101362 [Bacillus sp. V-88]|nr:hypothetical protein B1B00_01680 [Bacillus sp. DSM 27956]PRX79612.1 hypothetical protein B0G93_101362 [Bacillus sp. V-88]SLJ99625.1 hypothetical protein SAMN06295884_101362 [Bacillus sp. V-88]
MKRKIVFFLTGLLLLGGLLLYLIEDKQVYGNNKDSIVKVIHKIEGYENRSIKILEIKDFENRRVAVLLADNSPGYMEFRKDNKGNYRWSHLEIAEGQSFTFFTPFERTHLYVTNIENEIARMEVEINEQKVQQSFTPNKEMVIWGEIPFNEEREYTYRNYKYYDKEGKIISEIE